MIHPPKLKVGDTIALIAPSSIVPVERIKPAVDAMEKLGLKVILGESCTSNYGYLAGTDEIRAKDINIMFKDKSIKGIFAIRGGYGAARLLDKLDYNSIKNNPKIFAGYSDITALHIVFNQMCNLVTYHSPMAATELYKDVDNFTLESFLNTFFAKKTLGKLVNVSNDSFDTLVQGEAYGQITGGNLSLICSSLGTKYEINTKNKILFIEEVEEAPYRVDRMLLQLIQAKKLQNSKGIVLGAFTDCIAKDPNKSLSLDEIFNDLIKPLGIPTICNFPCGHQLPTLTLPLGSNAYLNATKGELILK